MAAQIARGLYGAGVATGDDDLHETADRVLVLVDELPGEDGAPAIAVDEEVWRVGREGGTVRVNGAAAGEDLVLHATARECWRIVDAAHSRPFRLTLDGNAFQVVGGDAGPLRTVRTATEVTLWPGDRVELVVEPAPRSRAVLWADPVDRGFGLDPGEPVPLFTVLGPARRGPALPPLPSTRDGLPPVALPEDVMTRPVTLSEGIAPNGEALFLVDGLAWPFSRTVSVRRGAREVWEIANCTAGTQPFHPHGLFFDVLDTAGQPPIDDGRQDVAEVPAGETLRIAVDCDAPGAWMYHTHLLDLAAHGMMAVLDVGDAEPTPPAPGGCP